MPTPSSGSSHRLQFVDLLRGWAVIVMIETHVVNATIMPVIAESSPFQWVKFVNGLVAPSFLFASGLAYAVTTRRKINAYLSFGTPLLKYFWRLAFLLLVAYTLHLPKFHLGKLLHDTSAEEWRLFFQVDILHCIAASLLILQCVLLIVRSERRQYRIIVPLTFLVVFLTPIVWEIDPLKYLPVPLAAYVNGLDYSLFPLFPWCAFLFAGAIAGYAFMQARDETPTSRGVLGTTRFIRRLAISGVILIVASFLFEIPAPSLYTTYDYWLFSPSFTMLRLGIVLLLCSGMLLFEQQWGVSARSVVTLIGRESFLVYVAHLMLIYGNFGGFNFRRSVNNTFGYGEAVGMSLVLIGLMYVLALFWDYIRKVDPRIKRGIQLAALLVVVGIFLFGPGS